MELNYITRRTDAPIISQNQLEQAISAGYTSDDESSDSDQEPQDSGRGTRSSARRANQVKPTEPTRTTRSSDKDPTSDGGGGGGKGRKRKKAGQGQDGSDSEPEDGQDKRRLCVEPVVEETEQVVCLCPKDVMTCIGILPSHPIVSYFQDSDDSDSSCNDDLSHTVLPSVTRHRKGGGGGGEGC